MDVANIIPLKLLTVREARNVDRRFCFEIVGPQIARRIYQATDSEEMRDWITVIQNAIEQALTEGFSGTVVYSPSGTLRGGGGGGGAGGGAGAGENQTTVPFEADPSLKTFTQIYSDHRKPVLEAARQADESNYNCADCGTRLPDWASINLGCLVCIECSGIHRSLGTHITKIRSMTLDTASWTPELVMVIEMLGNARVNAVFEATCDPRLKPTPHSTREQKTSFIKEKYISKIYTDRSGAVLQSCKVASANELLRHAVSLADIPLALNAIALGGGDSTTMASNNSSSSNNYSSRPILFDALKLPLLERSQKCREQDMAMAEFLLQNGVSTASALDITPIPVTSDTSSTSNNPSIYLDSMARFMSKQDFRGSGFVTFNLSLLHHAAYQRDVDLIALLISKGADPTAKVN